ncbi:ras-related protein Rab-3 isoform X2 [Eurytemora carolleeae]|uniref:ras-related protein Rab-3 isoform X2 n=1 Tax=Eurytemora carolleeae TaxID=1294199 RepID=UPI000C76930B|nr:ras-related protein Rab-3 isoform X2 [Eurytemora carolleeae]|eukprot:XP_023331649.1 ras-related protein Rab-3-like isoform X2 [Eurytemora affinis]
MSSIYSTPTDSPVTLRKGRIVPGARVGPGAEPGALSTPPGAEPRALSSPPGPQSAGTSPKPGGPPGQRPRLVIRPPLERSDWSRVSIGRNKRPASLREYKKVGADISPSPSLPENLGSASTVTPRSSVISPFSDTSSGRFTGSRGSPQYSPRSSPRGTSRGRRGRGRGMPPSRMSGTGQTWQKDAADQNFDYMFKLLIIGNSSVGKTSFLFRYADDSFTSAFVSTVGIDFKVKTVFRQDKRVKLQIWDTAGQERYRTITTAYYRGAMGFILMYDVTNEESFTSVHDWCTQIKTYSWDNAQVILVGNKCDMEDERVISYERGKHLADSLGLEFFETSAKENINVRAVFERLVDMICDKMSESLDADPGIGAKGTRLTDTAQPSNVNCNC